MITLKTIDEENFQACIDLTASVAEEDFVDSVLYSLAEAWLYKDNMEVFAIYHKDQLIGYVSIYVAKENPQIINFLIDDAFQGRSYGSQAAQLTIRHLQEKHQATRISLPVHVQHLKAQSFWRKQGFHPSDTIEDDYLFMRRE
ncbi:GNAT family N-acetyltransferase [Streptococcus acidominimus]|uniref:GNAT family N-acetyltransferase n=1 Tax=Streptococcus acidominimus TaxID=1326 RepID=A0A4Y9FRK1_STRAI|nr:GNAT family N-acetyltransferase [Streptococcus acidominimus]MBF0818503.1 GNAT family N-acetyltransferase [Streptococcus acidominimus]MBF0838955.1 GNAT family N-acetyltransferase [Streptococcus acidominimus]MBF0849047.1 GNAT family N-acetyltransferase [Streptococcus danieliae]TFU31143.1 GNAT family N-acetyltransferase [Streptococcus acidominimus]